MSTQNLKKDYLWNSVGVFIQNALSPVLILIITRVNGIEDSGLFSFAFSLAVIFWMLSMWGGRTYQVSDAKKEFTNAEYLSVRLLLTAVIIVLALGFAFGNGYDYEKTTLIVVLVVVKALESIADALYGIFQINGRLYIAGKSLVYKSILSLITFISADYFSGSVLVASAMLIVSNLLVIIFYDIPLSKRIETLQLTQSITYYIHRALEIMRRCWPIFIVMFLTVFSLNIPRYFLDKTYPAEVGYFGILAMPVTLIVLVMSFILQPNVVKLSKDFNKHNFKQFKKSVTRIFLFTTMIGAVVIIGSSLIGIQALELVFGISFDRYYATLLLIVLGATLNAFIAIFVNLFVIMRRFKEQFYILLFTNVALLCVASQVVTVSGIVGAIALFVLASGVQAVLLYIYYKRYVTQQTRLYEKN